MSSNGKGIDWRADLKSTMWDMFWVKQNASPADTEADKEALKNNVARLIRMATQKIGYNGTKRTSKALDWNSLDTTLMMIACAATSLCLNGEFGDMPETIEGDI